jgi:replicative DNA helicase
MMLPEGVVPPHSDAAEQAVLGALLVDNAAFDRVGDLLEPERFYRQDHRAIYGTICRLLVSGRTADVITVHEAGGHELAYLAELSQSVASAARARQHAEIIAERWREREMVRIGGEVIERAAQATDVPVAERLDEAVTKLLQVASGQRTGEPVDIGDAVVGWLDRLQDLAEGQSDAIPTGLHRLDALTSGGIRPGELWVIGARPSMGKTAFTGTLAQNISLTHSVLFMSQEDSLGSMINRQVASLGRVNLADLRNPVGAGQDMWQGVSEAVDRLRNMRLRLDDQGGLTLLDARRKMQQVKRRWGLRVAIVDYLQLMVGTGANRNAELGAIANGLKQAAKDLDVGIVLLSQLNREADKRSGVPQVADLRDSGDIEGAADLIALLHREYKRNPTEANKHWAQLHVAKQKNGPTDTLNLWFDGRYQTFRDWSIDGDGPIPRAVASKSFKGSGGGLE